MTAHLRGGERERGPAAVIHDCIGRGIAIGDVERVRARWV